MNKINSHLFTVVGFPAKRGSEPKRHKQKSFAERWFGKRRNKKEEKENEKNGETSSRLLNLQTEYRKRFSGKLLAQLKTECHELLNLDESDAIERHVTAVVTSKHL